MKIYKIRLELELDEESEYYTVTSPDVPGLVTAGRNPVEVQANVQEAIEGLFLAWKEVGQEPPPALRRPQSSQRQRSFLTDGLVMA
ncbi:MAG TPA: hypothetical protein G4N96_12025 [Chloroflexi bacterium]|nr:MAG: hypothetical protein B6243_00500 [Anaerolineaceae bacterium 4572_5.2]HEY85824.1 hypothetical protein [Chloroflexota bacterium]